MSIKHVIILQCEIAKNRCSGFACTKAFYDKEVMFENYNDNTKYMAMTCGGCSGKGVAARLEHYGKHAKANNIEKDDVSIHLSSCMVTDNHHYDRCPHVDYIKSIIQKKGYKNILEGSYISQESSRKRKKGIYKTY